MQNSAQSAIFPPQNHYLYDSYFIFHSCVIINLLFLFLLFYFSPFSPADSPTCVLPTLLIIF